MEIKSSNSGMCAGGTTADPAHLVPVASFHTDVGYVASTDMGLTSAKRLGMVVAVMTLGEKCPTSITISITLGKTVTIIISLEMINRNGSHLITMIRTPSQAVLLLLVLNFCYLCQVVQFVILINATISAGYLCIYAIIINAFNS